MPTKDLVLDANPFSLVTSPKTIKIDPRKIVGRDDIEHDPTFIKQYKKYIQKKDSCFVTRVTLDRILPGFYKSEDGEPVYIEDSLLDGAVEHCISIIKSGERPALHIRRLFNNHCGHEYSSSDDVHLYYAYKALEITRVPVVIYGSAGELEESAFRKKGYFRELEDHFYSFSNVNIQHKGFYSVAHKYPQSTPEEIVFCIEKLESLVSHTKCCFKGFHEFRYDVHYHTIIYAILMRLGEDLASIKLLVKNGLYIQSAGVLRSIYELMLNFYLVWLNPQEMPSMLKYKSLMSESELIKVIKKANTGLTKGQLGDLERVYRYQYKLVSTIIEKAKLSPFGESYYNDIYRFLSDVTHHDFSSTARYRHALEHGDSQVYNVDVLNTVVSITDFITTFVCHYVMDDIGHWVKDQKT
ncbi:DUF5677 domain-containing protein [Vibrio vulnificus]|uniref:DUF5677 domain-containing protein n=1 Tax=Vibrio vulnificus TaxID=672 RepID=UPI0021D9B2A1|nr:hypothetical protein [Vibrio vulnificus]